MQPTGIEVAAGVGANTIGGTTAATGNVISFSTGSASRLTARRAGRL